ncbi:MAG: serine hydrolase [Inhella sp.]
MRQPTTRRHLIQLLGGGAMGGLLAGCGGGADEPPAPPEPAEALATNLLLTTPANQAATYRNVDRIAPTRRVRRGGAVRALPAHARSLGGLKFDFAGQPVALDDYLARNRVGGLLILKDGAVALERYGLGNTPASLWTSFSLTKSITATLVGAALREGHLASLDEGVAQRLPALRGTAYAANTVRELLRMSSGVAWNEDYALGAESDIGRLVQAVQANRRGAVLELLASRPRAAAPGTVFNYSTGESFVLGALVAAATGRTLSEYLSDRIWSRAGMEADAYWMLEAAEGLEMGGDNLSATLRDYGRLGLFLLQEDGSRLPPGWLRQASQPEGAPTACGSLYPGYPLGYGYQWWSFPSGADALPGHDGAFAAMGIFGQFLYLNPRENLVAVVCSAWPAPWVDAAELETFALLGTAVAALR